eukprot:1125313-Heterocapsa_arctica.AAC.1
MGGHWVYNSVPRPILPHPNTWTLEGIFELHSSPIVCESIPSLNPEEVEYWDRYLISERAIATMANSEEKNIACSSINLWPCID